jgi:hypothetical protein
MIEKNLPISPMFPPEQQTNSKEKKADAASCGTNYNRDFVAFCFHRHRGTLS